MRLNILKYEYSSLRAKTNSLPCNKGFAIDYNYVQLQSLRTTYALQCVKSSLEEWRHINGQLGYVVVALITKPSCYVRRRPPRRNVISTVANPGKSTGCWWTLS